MKNLVLLFIFMLSSFVIAAGQTITINDFQINQTKAVTLGEKDRIAFDILNGSHTIIIDNIRNTSVNLDIFPYLKNVFYTTLKQGTFLKIDLNRDFFIDLIIRLEKNEGNITTLSLERVNIDERPYYMKKYNLSEPYNPLKHNLTDLKEKNSTNVTIKVDEDLIKPDPWKGILIIISVLITGIGVYYLFNKKK